MAERVDFPGGPGGPVRRVSSAPRHHVPSGAIAGAVAIGTAVCVLSVGLFLFLRRLRRRRDVTNATPYAIEDAVSSAVSQKQQDGGTDATNSLSPAEPSAELRSELENIRRAIDRIRVREVGSEPLPTYISQVGAA